ncbi:hypothetical protein ACLOJK_006413 [Asimina triloba]
MLDFEFGRLLLLHEFIATLSDGFGLPKELPPPTGIDDGFHSRSESVLEMVKTETLLMKKLDELHGSADSLQLDDRLEPTVLAIAAARNRRRRVLLWLGRWTVA